MLRAKTLLSATLVCSLCADVSCAMDLLGTQLHDEESSQKTAAPSSGCGDKLLPLNKGWIP